MNLNNLQQKILTAWYKPYSWTLLLLPLSWLFQLIILLRRSILSANAYQSPCSIIVVGNITLGGTGKTPLVIHLAKLLSHQGYKVGIISRGYGRTNSADQIIIINHLSDVQEAGDEPLLIAQQTKCPVVIGANRCLAIENLLSHFPNTQIIISDDGLQHYKMAHDIEIVVINGIKRLGNQCCLPAGPLREPASRLNHVDYIIATHHAQANEFLLKYTPKQFVCLDTTIERMTVTKHNFAEVHAIAGIGDPAPFFSSLEALGIKIKKHVFPDHHWYQPTDFDFGDNLPIIMTEKDAIKCRAFNLPDAWFLAIETDLSKEFERLIKQRVKGLVHGKKII